MMIGCAVWQLFEAHLCHAMPLFEDDFAMSRHFLEMPEIKI
jgi:hypothetical protein